MRLIDADVLQEHFEKVKKESERLVDVAQIIGVQAVIDSQPTAYDVDKVVKKLENKISALEELDTSEEINEIRVDVAIKELQWAIDAIKAEKKE